MDKEIKANYHMHTNYCDGKNTPEEMVQACIEKKFTHIGFSSHVMYPVGDDWHISPSKIKDYCETIKKLKEQYKNSISIHLGFEADFLPEVSLPTFENYAEFSPEYLIGSVHYVFNTEKHHDFQSIKDNAFSVDGPVEELRKGLLKEFNNDGKKLVQTYFALQREMIKNCNVTIIGHPDVIRKRNGVLHFFDENATWYKQELEETAKAIAQSNAILEINTGGIARGAVNDTYPSLDFLEILKKYDIRYILSSDAHAPEHLESGYQQAATNIQKTGISVVQKLF